MFIFTAWEQGLSKQTLPLASVEISDIQSLNQLALSRSVDLCKVSAAILKDLHSDYVLLPVGAGISYGAGPKLVGRKNLPLSEIRQSRVISPGPHTMAHRLLETLIKPREIISMNFREIVPALQAGICNAGVIINEARFLLHELGLYEIADLGQCWEQETSLPLPLGALVAKRSLDSPLLARITSAISHSLDFAQGNFAQVFPYIQKQSTEKDEGAIRRHIELYVSADTYSLSPQGKKAFALLGDYEQARW